MEEELKFLAELRGTMVSSIIHIDKDNYEEDYLSLKEEIRIVTNIIEAIVEYQAMID